MNLPLSNDRKDRSERLARKKLLRLTEDLQVIHKALKELINALPDAQKKELAKKIARRS